MSQSQSQPQSQSRQSDYGRQGLPPPPPPPPLQQYPPHLAYAHSGAGACNGHANSNPYHHLQQANAATAADRSSPEQGPYSIIPQTRSRPTSPENVSGSPDRKRYMSMSMNGRDGGGARENDPALQNQGTTPPDPGTYSGGNTGLGGGGGGGDTTTGGGLKNGGTTSKKSKASAVNLTANGTAAAGGSASSSGGGQAPPLKRGNACNICRKRKLVRPLFRSEVEHKALIPLPSNPMPLYLW